MEAQGDGYYPLSNVGDAPAYTVHIDLGDTGGAVGNVLAHDLLAPGSAVRFGAQPDFDTGDDTVTARWALSPNGHALQTWRRPLPPPPDQGGVLGRVAMTGWQSRLPVSRTSTAYPAGHRPAVSTLDGDRHGVEEATERGEQGPP